ncbi:uncharacterized protein LOC130894015 isoform X1 [Diorhabda carinulata]|uniref:uncharacterized protein LOC130894015 isoform X1 n=1 Tax=Diorhabda carinulata TaxID=1163345 RepID=UPI00259FF74D|nr:uncharacterized protein LOC130894015 isoform X1 [Diorhabda carinulata]XP_057656504.1 uncharacterized protein LOC130894015 isoform X1 [Diorhabda carinulata]XP_057656505.1 uncharacterized protein LOC130894015 isoform X1 [Diorhabda carinulata]XP_057656506.1 uncharacterized protein LOC130894015 isoform X1 [Diorhabda carinulata]
MEVVAASPNGAPFRDHDVREWSRIDSITGALERARLETDHWSANTINSSHKYGKVVDSRARTDADGALYQSAKRQLEVFSSEVPGGRLQVVKTHTVSTSKWSSTGNNKDFENLQLTLNPLDLSSQKSKASVGRSAARRPPTRQRAKENLQPSIDLNASLRSARITAATNLDRVSRLCHQIHESAVKQAFGRRSPRLSITDRESGDGGVEISEIESDNTSNNNVNGHTNLVRTKTSSNDDISLIPEKDTNGNKSVNDLEDLEQLQNWRRSSKIRRSLHFPKENKQTHSKPVDLPDNSGSVRKIREEIEKGRRLNTALRNNSVDLDALDQILQSISSSGSDKTSEDQETELPKKQKRNSFVTVESIQEIKGRLRKTSSPTSDIYKENGKDEDPDDGIVTEETSLTTQSEMPIVENSRVRSYVYGMETLLNKKPGIGTGSLESRVKLIPTNKNEDWYNRRKSYGFEKVHHHNDSQSSILFKTKNFVESSTDSGICRSTEIDVPTKKNGNKDNEYSSDEHNDFEQKYKEFNHNNKHQLGQVKRIANTFNQEDSMPPANKNEKWKKDITDWSMSPTEIKSTTITIPITKNNNVVDLPWNDTNKEQLRDVKRHSIAVDESKYVIRHNDNSFRRISLAFNDQSRHDDEDNNMRKTKKVEFCKTEVHFAAESGKVNIVATDDKPPPTQNFRRRRRNSGPTIEEFSKNGLPLLHFGDMAIEKSLFNNSEDTGSDSIYENLQSRLPSSYALVTVNSNNPINADISEEEKKELTENEIRGILKNKPIKPKPYHLGESTSFSENTSDDETKWGVRLRHVEKPEVPIWKSTVTVHNYNFMNQEKENEPEFQKLLKNLRPTRKSDYASDSDSKFGENNIDTNYNDSNGRMSSWPNPEITEPSKEVKGMEIKGYSTKICLREGEATVVENESFDEERQSIRPRIENLREDSKHLLNKSLVVRIGKEDSALNHTLCSKMSTTEDTNNTTTTTKITIDLSPSPSTKTDKTFSYTKYERSQPTSFKSTSLILNTINHSNNGNIQKTAEIKDSIPKELEALKKLYEDVQSDSDADKEVQFLLSRMTKDNGLENDCSSVLSGSWSKMKTYRNMNNVKEATTTKLSAKIEKDSLELSENSPLATRIQDGSIKQHSTVNIIRTNLSPNPVRETPVCRPDLKPSEQLSSPSIVNRSKNIEVTRKPENKSTDYFKINIENKKIHPRPNDGVVLRTPKKSEMTYFGVNVSPKPAKKISQAVIRKENRLSEKPDLIQKKSPLPIRKMPKSPSPIRRFQKTPSPTMINKNPPPITRSGKKSPVKEVSEPIYENIKNKYGREFDSSILDELTKAADQILQAVNGYTDEELHNRLSSDDEDDSKKKKLETILETKSTHQKTSITRHKVSANKTKLKPISPSSSIESLNKKRVAPEPKMKPCYEKHRRRTERIEKMEKLDQNSTKAANTKARRLQRASSREALLRSNGSSSEDLPTKVEPPRKPRLIKKTKVMQLTVNNGMEFKKSSISSDGRRKEDTVNKIGEERIHNSLPEIRHKTAVSSIRSTSEKTTRDRMKYKSEDPKRKIQQKKEPIKSMTSSTRSDREKSAKQPSHLHKETVTHRISTANIKKCYRSEGSSKH